MKRIFCYLLLKVIDLSFFYISLFRYLMNQIGQRKQILGICLLLLLIAGISCSYLTLFTHLCCSSVSEPYHSFNFPDCSLLPNIVALEVNLFVLFGLIPLFFLPPIHLVPHLSEFIRSLFKPPRLATYLS